MYMARFTGEDRYRQAAIDVLEWSNLNTWPDGSWVNEPTGSVWRGITVFGAAALGEALRHHGDLLDDRDRKRWEDRLRRAADFLHGFLTIETGNINYPISGALALAIAGDALAEPRYTARARELAHMSLGYFTSPNTILWGEGKKTSVTGLHSVDLGYNVEESLPNFALYATITGDKEVLDMVIKSFRSHLDFMLPDGGWDNSWGLRNFKWTYWGSRTSDGCHSGLMLLADRDPLFAEAAMRNLQLLKSCTHDGFLYSGPHYQQHGELPCIHHTFCHARALAGALDHGKFGDQPTSIALPRDTAIGVREFPEIATWLVSEGLWRATITAYDVIYYKLIEGHVSGGALSMLWHQATGPVLCASMLVHKLEESSNMHTPKCANDEVPLTPRLELRLDEKVFRSDADFTAKVSSRKIEGGTEFEVRGQLVDIQQESPASGIVPFNMAYRFTETGVQIHVSTGKDIDSGSLTYLLPIVSLRNEPVQHPNELTLEIEKPEATIRVTANLPVKVDDSTERVFNHVPGLEALPLAFSVLPGGKQPLVVEISVV
jgi:hypothetical protein